MCQRWQLYLTAVSPLINRATELDRACGVAAIWCIFFKWTVMELSNESDTEPKKPTDRVPQKLIDNQKQQYFE